MPEHISTEEAVVIIQKGSAILKIDGNVRKLKKDEICIIPGGKPHTLSITDEFQAIIVMALSSKIEFTS